MQILRNQKMYLPALSILAIVVLLFFLISISTYRNLNRDKRQAAEALRRQGVTLLQALDAGAHAVISMSGWQPASLERLFREAAENRDVAYLLLRGPDAQVLFQAGSPPGKEYSAASPQPRSSDGIASRITRLADGTRIYELVRSLDWQPFGSSSNHTKPSGRAPGAAEANRLRENQAASEIVVGLKMDAYEAAQEADLHHAILMGGIILVLGCGALYFLFVVQNYYLVDVALKRTQDYTRQVVANMANGLLSVDAAGRIVSYNLLALELLGLKESEAKNFDLRRVVDFEVSGISSTLGRGEAILDRELEYRKRNGAVVPLSLSITPLPGEKGNFDGAVIILRDLSEIKRLQERVRRTEKLAAIGKMAASVAHEIRNPLSSIRGFAQFFRHALQDRPQDREYASVMVKEVDRINRVVTDLLSIARPLVPHPAPTQVDGLIEHTLRLIQGDVRAQEMTIRSRVMPGLPPVLLDPHQMTQALLNLVLNALQAVSAGGNIEVGATLTAGGQTLRIWVEDDGAGIPSEHAPRVFDPFFTTREKGTGLGLAIVQKIVETHGGEIRSECPPEDKSHGCRFVIELPAVSLQDHGDENIQAKG